MSVKSMMRASVALTALTLAVWADGAAAQTQPIPPEHYTLDPRGVDLVSGGFNFGTTEVVIGQPGADGLAYGRTFTNEGWRDNLIGGISASGTDMVVSVGPVSEVFVQDGAGWVSKYSNGSTYEVGVGVVTVTDRNGVVAVFDRLLGVDPETNPYGASAGLITSLTTPTGEVTTYTYQTGSWCTGHCRPVHRLSAITNNRGYMLKYTYASDSPANNTTWFRLANVRGINLAKDYCSPTANSCSSFTETWPSVTYGAFDANGWPTTATDQASRTTTYGYGAAGLSSIRYPEATADDVAVSYNASPDFRVNAVTDASGAWTYGYSVTGATQTTSVAGPLGQALTVLTDTTTGRATSITDALSHTWAYQYDADLRVTRVTQPEGDYAQFEYDDRSNLIETTWIPKTNTIPAIVVSSTFPATCADIETCNKPSATTDARGGVTDYVWDSDTGQLVSVTLPAPTGGAARPQTRYAYGDFQARYHDSASTYVNGGSISLPTGVSACATGNPQTAPTPICTTTANEVVSAVEYPTTADPNNLLPVSISQGSGATPVMAEVEMTYTPQGDILEVDGPLSGSADIVTYVYATLDPRQRIGVIGPDPDGAGPRLNGAQRLTYNDRGQVELAETGTASGGVWANFVPLLKSQTVYDTTAYFRPIEARQLSAADVASGVQQVGYDAAGRPSCTALRMNPATWSSPLPGACTAAAVGGFGPDRIGQVSYDAVGRVVSTTTALGTSDALTESVSYTANGRVGSLTDGNGNISIMEYDAFDRMVKLRYPDPVCCGTSTTDYEQYAYNPAGLPTSFRNRAGATTAFGWDALGRLIQVNAPVGTMSTVTGYDNLGRQTSTAGNGLTVNTAYDALSRPVSQSTTGLGTMAYAYDAAGRMTRITWPDTVYAEYDHDVTGAVTAVRENGAASGVGVLATYGYDNLGMLTTVARADGAGVASAWSYDAHARLTGLTHNASGTGNDLTLGFGYNPASQIVARTVSNDAYVYTPAAAGVNYTRNGLNQITAIGGAAVTYDGDQNTTEVLGSDYGYDAAGRLISADAGVGSSTFAFDPQGRLARADVGAAATRFQYALIQMVAEYDGSGTLIRRHVPGLGIDGVVTSYNGSGLTARNWLLADERGSVVGMAGATGAVGTVNRYDEYGVPASGNAGRFQYTGQAWLAESGGYHYRARTYLPTIGRFFQTDPIGYAAGANVYAYVGLDPINFVDPSGLQESPPPTNPGDWLARSLCGAGSRYNTLLRTCTTVVSRETVFDLDRLNTSYANTQDPTGPNSGSGTTAAQRECEAYHGPSPANGAFACNAEGRLEITPEYQEQICENAEALQRGSDIFGDSSLFGAGLLGGFVSWVSKDPRGAIIVGGLAGTGEVIAQATTGQGFQPFGFQLIPRVEVEGC